MGCVSPYPLCSQTSSGFPTPLAVPEDTVLRTAGPNLPEIDMLYPAACVCAELLSMYKCPVSPRECLIVEILFQLSVWPVSNESAKETKKPLTGSKDPSEDQGSHASEASAASISSTQLVYVVSDLGRLQEWVSFAALDTGSVNCGRAPCSRRGHSVLRDVSLHSGL